MYALSPTATIFQVDVVEFDDMIGVGGVGCYTSEHVFFFCSTIFFRLPLFVALYRVYILMV